MVAFYHFGGDTSEYVIVGGTWRVGVLVGTATIPALNAGAVAYGIRVNFPAGSFSGLPFVSIEGNAVRISFAVSARTNAYFEFAAANWTNANQASSVASYIAFRV